MAPHLQHTYFAAALCALSATAACPHRCSLNGYCKNDACQCHAGWRGADCGALDLADAAAKKLWPPRGSSWGGTVVADGPRHRLFVSEMAEGCGLATWRTNSRVVTATSSRGPLGPYKSDRVLIPPFGHNAQLIRKTRHSPWILMHIGGHAVAPKKGCRDGVTPKKGRRRLQARPRLGTRVLVADNLAGPWNATILSCGAGHENCDFANPSMAISPVTGSALAAYKLIHGPGRGRSISFATALSWRGPFVPVGGRWNAKPAIPCGTKKFWACEDPFLWRDSAGNHHAIFHHGDARAREDVGGHAFSSDGKTWELSESNAYAPNVTTSDGAAHRYARPQRPQLYLSDAGTPLMLILGVAGDHLDAGPGMCVPPNPNPGCDRSYTLGVPVVVRPR